MNIETARELHVNPLEVLELAQQLMTKLGVEASPQTDPNGYIEQLSKIDPRSQLQEEAQANDQDLEEQQKEKMSRQAMQARVQGGAPIKLASLVMSTADDLGLTIEKYPFDDFAQGVDAILVTSGAASAIKDRTDFAVDEGPDVPIYISGGPRSSTKYDAPFLISEGQDPEDFNTQADIATFVAERHDDERVQASISRIEVADNYDVIREFATKHPEIASFALATTGLYVPSVTAIKGSIISEFRGSIEARVYADSSDPAKVAARSPEIYLSEVIKTAVDNVRHKQALIRRRIKK